MKVWKVVEDTLVAASAAPSSPPWRRWRWLLGRLFVLFCKCTVLCLCTFSFCSGIEHLPRMFCLCLSLCYSFVRIYWPEIVPPAMRRRSSTVVVCERGAGLPPSLKGVCKFLLIRILIRILMKPLVLLNIASV